jgi:hypothetical protein
VVVGCKKSRWVVVSEAAEQDMWEAEKGAEHPVELVSLYMALLAPAYLDRIAAAESSFSPGLVVVLSSSL